MKKLSKGKMQSTFGGNPYWLARAIISVGVSAWKNRQSIRRGYRDGIKSYREF